jgi:hypothetical protein
MGVVLARRASGPNGATRALAICAAAVSASAAAMLLLSALIPLRFWDDGPLVRLWQHVAPYHHCRTCGLTHSFSAISHGNLTLAREYNDLGPALFGCVVATAVAGALLAGCLTRSWSRGRGPMSCGGIHSCPTLGK